MLPHQQEWKTQKPQENTNTVGCEKPRLWGYEQNMALSPPSSDGTTYFLLTALTHLGMSGAETGWTDPVWSCKAQPVSFFPPETALEQFPCFSPLFPFLSPSLRVAGHLHPRSSPGTLHIFPAVRGSSVLCGWFLWVVLFFLWGVLLYFILKAGDAQP